MRLVAQRSRALAACGALALVGLLAGCDNLLKVTNPSAITDDDLNGDSATIQFMANGVIGEYRREYGWLAAHGAAFTDEAIQGHPYSPWNAYDARNVTPNNGIHDPFTYPLLQRARGTADELIPKMEAALGDRATSSVLLAKAYAYAGYSYVALADHLCEAPINLSAPHPQSEIYQMAIERFQKAIDIATAAGAQTGASDALYLAKVGLARANLDLGNNSEAIAAATGVPDDFEAWIRYVADAGDWQVYNFFNWFAGYRFVGELDLALEPAGYGAVVDNRMPRDPTLRRLADGTRDGFLPYQSESFSEWTPGDTTMFKETTDIRFSSGLEARYIIAEAGGMSSTALRAFIDERRAVGAGAASPFAGADAQLFGELLTQRLRDFFLDGHRMGDLRRYKALYSLDFWPTGTMPGLTQTYGTQECWPIGASEINSNPNIPRS